LIDREGEVAPASWPSWRSLFESDEAVTCKIVEDGVASISLEWNSMNLPIQPSLAGPAAAGSQQF
jgi:hypothetical protein